MNNVLAAATTGRRGRGGSPISPTEAKKRASAHLGGGKQTQDAGTIEKQDAPAKKKPGPKPRQQQATGTKPAATKTTKPKQTQDAGDTSRQGEGTTDKSGTQNVTLGATREVNGVKIEVMAVPAFGGRAKPEKYPFSELGFATVVNDEVIGDSIFIPDSDGPGKHLTAARKRVRGSGIRFMMRNMTHEGVKGQRFWKHQKD